MDFAEGTAVKKLIEDAGVPLTEVDMILINGESVGLSRKLKQGDRISVYPAFESFDIRSISRVRPCGLRKTRFVLNVHLGRLSTWLRSGFDALHSNSCDDRTLCQISAGKKRILLTRDRELLKRKIISHGYCLRSKETFQQLSEVMGGFGLEKQVKPFSRCLRFNTLFQPAENAEIKGQVPPLIVEKYNEFRKSPVCNKIFWKGTLWKNAKSIIAGILQNSAQFSI